MQAKFLPFLLLFSLDILNTLYNKRYIIKRIIITSLTSVYKFRYRI